ncbi:hypothetical protein SAMN04487851_104196 [Prevotella sp. tc2-28]|jgi:hypothetical protein|uniref:hypothetical protein n=1 Tax=Prevotella sp. tc2-28 TaxID=1761888 RepID=UPI00089D65E8|nr:hypothetical protein [Prevotella sp. tc2-28]SEA30064.1 hypothetical protein SAMN04487851_104196 [Prevotella sp. tc2-28]
MKPIWNPGKTAITINKKELIDLVSCIDYLPSAGFLPVYPIYFAASTDDKVIEGMAGLDKEENQVLYVKGKLVNKQDPDEMKYEQISKMMTDYFNLNDDSVIYLLEGSFTGKFIRPNHSIPVTDVLGNPVITEED